jgi:hypothetical protein
MHNFLHFHCVVLRPIWLLNPSWDCATLCSHLFQNVSFAFMKFGACVVSVFGRWFRVCIIVKPDLSNHKYMTEVTTTLLVEVACFIVVFLLFVFVVLGLYKSLRLFSCHCGGRFHIICFGFLMVLGSCYMRLVLSYLRIRYLELLGQK